ncbi:type II toxin-antitoxin system HicA family toxin [Geitlerinema sp. P-1104]|uniref:type II toxin-antitoxin system HicA family toxin n=1 Tax=Geitlerinema sp. P-1104 TaxID=2546230 RepID=UPI0014772605|nr:type II toxin-antitoxin system HicA family toxin [Geitlerinema sp. P-1104]NMG57177.1 type II toxin-antitoxin system HicA family toxin [Geitlerinema sp. P-1104]
MPQKIRDLKKKLRQIGFVEVPGKGSHTNWIHRFYQGKLTISGKANDDAKPYQEKAVNQAIMEVQSKNHDE